MLYGFHRDPPSDDRKSMPVHKLVEQRFWENTSLPDGIDGCWIWTGDTRNGYGTILSVFYAHRVSYELAYGVNPGNFLVHHKCKKKKCVNPQHLELVNHWQHAQRHKLGQ